MSDLRSTKKQKELLSFVDSFIQGNGYGPSYREIMRALGYKSVSTVAIHIEGLIAKGYLHKRTRSARSLEVVTTSVEPLQVKKAVTAGQEKWLVGAINDRFNAIQEKYSEDIVNELYVLVGSLKILGLEEAHVATKAKLLDLQKKLSGAK